MRRWLARNVDVVDRRSSIRGWVCNSGDLDFAAFFIAELGGDVNAIVFPVLLKGAARVRFWRASER